VGRFRVAGWQGSITIAGAQGLGLRAQVKNANCGAVNEWQMHVPAGQVASSSGLVGGFSIVGLGGFGVQATSGRSKLQRRAEVDSGRSMYVTAARGNQ
jgi:hypothetical protein